MRNPKRCLTLSALLILCAHAGTLFAQNSRNNAAPVFTRADTLRGMLRPERTCYDVRWYDLDVRIDPERRFISGSNTIRFTAMEASSRLQVDLFANMTLESATLNGGAPLHFTREFNAVFIALDEPLRPGTTYNLLLKYSGNPQVAKNPPWDGGMIWTKDSSGNPWVAVACEGTGASLWWPNKDHLSDEPDSMRIRVTVPPGLEDVSNGRLRGVTTLPDGWRRFDWAVTYPINNYCVTVNVGKFAHFGETYMGEDTVSLDYYVLPGDLAKAEKQFTQVKPMFACYEKNFGPYPFARDGYKLVQSPHLGMEHQSAVAYGNGFRNGYRGTSSSPWGLKFDFIIIHESAHEWWGNGVTAKDVADMWIHESFGAHAEALYVECTFGKQAMLEYVNSKKSQVLNQRPILGVYNVNNEGSGDMYPKGSLMLNTLRGVMDNDSLWFAVMRGMSMEFRYKTITTADIVAYVNRATGTNYTYFFDQYLRYPAIPKLDVFLIERGGEPEMPVPLEGGREGFPHARPGDDDPGEVCVHPSDDRVADDGPGVHGSERIPVRRGLVLHRYADPHDVPECGVGGVQKVMGDCRVRGTRWNTVPRRIGEHGGTPTRSPRPGGTLSRGRS